MKELFEQIRDNFDNKENLQKILLFIVEEQLKLASLIADKELSFDSAYLVEKESSYKVTDSEVKARTRQLVGTDKTRYQYEFDALTNLLNVIELRINKL